ncbi:MAG: hypothetical protein VX741_00575 [Pseudomonadota bacterium]|nr:hypothetical protein [Pseudomonadota bacterium]
MAARQHGECRDITTVVRPLSGTESTINSDEQANRCVEELIPAFSLFRSSLVIVTGRAEGSVKLIAMTEQTAGIGLRQIFGNDRKLGFPVSSIASFDHVGGLTFEFAERFPGQGIYVPRLYVPVGCGAPCPLDQITVDLLIDRFVEEPSTGHTRIYRFENIHGSPLYDGRFPIITNMAG